MSLVTDTEEDKEQNRKTPAQINARFQITSLFNSIKNTYLDIWFWAYA